MGRVTFNDGDCTKGAGLGGLETLPENLPTDEEEFPFSVSSN